MASVGLEFTNDERQLSCERVWSNENRDALVCMVRRPGPDNSLSARQSSLRFTRLLIEVGIAPTMRAGVSLRHAKISKI